MKIVFLDIDGVLNSASTRPPDPQGLIDWLDPANVAPLARALNATGARVVIVSSWRRTTSLSQLREAFAVRGMDAEILDVTPTLGPGVDSREQEVLAWLQNAAEPPEDWVVVDDEVLAGLGDRQIRTSKLRGFTEDDGAALVARFAK